ncbi:MAG: YlbF family regulator [Clostridiales bacterium]|nr:YlbF family regulator [Clostridiales bacterium]
MDVIALVRQLGAALQQDDRYLKFQEARKANDADEELNALIGKINLVQMSYQQEAAKSDANEQKLQAYDKEFNEIYGQVMLNANMQAYEVARGEVDELMNYIVGILSMCVNGEDPETCEPPKEHEHNCGGECSSCSGC